MSDKDNRKIIRATYIGCPADQYLAAKQLMRDGRPGDAIIIYANLIKENPPGDEIREEAIMEFLSFAGIRNFHDLEDILKIDNLRQPGFRIEAPSASIIQDYQPLFETDNYELWETKINNQYSIRRKRSKAAINRGRECLLSISYRSEDNQIKVSVSEGARFTLSTKENETLRAAIYAHRNGEEVTMSITVLEENQSD